MPTNASRGLSERGDSLLSFFQRQFCKCDQNEASWGLPKLRISFPAGLGQSKSYLPEIKANVRLCPFEKGEQKFSIAKRTLQMGPESKDVKLNSEVFTHPKMGKTWCAIISLFFLEFPKFFLQMKTLNVLFRQSPVIYLYATHELSNEPRLFLPRLLRFWLYKKSFSLLGLKEGKNPPILSRITRFD